MPLSWRHSAVSSFALGVIGRRSLGVLTALLGRTGGRAYRPCKPTGRLLFRRGSLGRQSEGSRSRETRSTCSLAWDISVLKAVVLFAMVVAVGAVPAARQIDTPKSVARFSVQHIWVERVTGTVPIVSAAVTLAAGSVIPTSVTAVLDPARIATGEPDRARSLASRILRCCEVSAVAVREYDDRAQGFECVRDGRQSHASRRHATRAVERHDRRYACASRVSRHRAD